MTCQGRRNGAMGRRHSQLAEKVGMIRHCQPDGGLIKQRFLPPGGNTLHELLNQKWVQDECLFILGRQSSRLAAHPAGPFLSTHTPV